MHRAPLSAALALAVASAGCGLWHYETTGCPIQTDEITLAHYRFDQTAIAADETGAHDGTLFGSAPSNVTGAPGCGDGFAGGPDRWVEVAHSDAWELDEGSLDLFVQFGTPPETAAAQGVISRDASGQNLPGHFTIYYSMDGRVGVRIQPSASACTDQSVTQGTWYHLGVNFGRCRALAGRRAATVR